MAQKPKLDLFDVLLGFFIAVTVEPIVQLARLALRGTTGGKHEPRDPEERDRQ